MKLFKINSSSYYKLNRIDTLFNLNNDNVIRKYMGYYFINNRVEQNVWEVQQIQFSKRILTIHYVSNEERIKTLEKITESNLDTLAPNNYSVTKKQFKDFVKNDGFGSNETYVRLK